MKKINKRIFKEMKKIRGRPVENMSKKLSKLKVNQAVSISFKDWKAKSHPCRLVFNLKKFGMAFNSQRTPKGWAIMRIK